MEYLRYITPAPSIAFHERPPDGASHEAYEQIFFNERAEGAGGNEDDAVDVKPRLWDGDQVDGGDSEAGRRSRVDMSFRDEDGMEEASPLKHQHTVMHHRSPQMLRAGSGLKSANGHKVHLPSMLRPTRAMVYPVGGTIAVGEKSDILTENENRTVEEELNGGLGEDVEMMDRGGGSGGEGGDSAA
jgi:hypothetical protein